MKLTKQICDKFQIVKEDLTRPGTMFDFPGYPPIYYSFNRQWFDNEGRLIRNTGNGYKTLWDLIKAMNEIRSKKIKSTK